MKSRLVSWGALAVGIVLFIAALSYINLDLAAGTIRRLGLALPLALLVQRVVASGPHVGVVVVLSRSLARSASSGWRGCASPPRPSAT